VGMLSGCDQTTITPNDVDSVESRNGRYCSPDPPAVKRFELQHSSALDSSVSSDKDEEGGVNISMCSAYTVRVFFLAADYR